MFKNMQFHNGTHSDKNPHPQREINKIEKKKKKRN